MSLTQDNIDGFRTTLSEVVGQDGSRMFQDQQVEIAVALMRMLNQRDLSWNFDKCDQFVGKLVSDITTGQLNQQQINELMITMAQIAGAPVIPDTVLKVERYRRGFLYLLAAGVSFATLQSMFPGVISFVLDSTYALYQLLRQTSTDEAIAQQAAASVSPLSAGSMAQAIAVSSTNLVTAAFYACADVAKTCASAISQNYADCLRYGTELLGFAVATRVVPPVVKKAADFGASVVGVASGSADEKIAQWIDNGGPQKVQAAIQNTLADAVENTKRAIGQSINDIDEINQGMIDPTIKPPSRYGPLSINELIYNWLHTYIENFQGDYHAAITSLIGDLSEIDFSDTEGLSDEGNPGVLAIMDKYRIRWDDPEAAGFRALIAVWKLATEKPEKIEHSSSQPDPRSEDWVHPAALSLNRSYSLTTDRMAFPVDPHDPSATKYGVKTTKQIGPPLPFNPSLKVESPVIKSLRIALTKYGLLNTQFPKGSDFVGKTVYEVVSREIEDNQKALLKVLEEKESRDPSILQLSPLEKKKAIEANKLRYLAAIEKFLSHTKNVEVSEEEMQTELGGRRRHRKSRHHKKKRSTLKRRGLKRRRTRKGKKRRHTRKH